MQATKSKDEILRQALYKLQRSTPVTSIGAGSVARSLAEVIVDELGDLYAAMDYNTSMSLISTASGRALDLLAELYSMERKTLGDIASTEQLVGSFLFYLDSPHTSDVQIPSGTRVATDTTNFIGREYSYTVLDTVVIPAGRTRVFARIRPLFSDSTFTAGEGTITTHNVTTAPEVELKCKNIKTIAPTIGYETDANFRARIKNEVRRSAGGTVDSIRFSGLAVNGVRDIRVKPANYGLGSAKVIVVPEDAREIETVMPRVEEAIQQVAPVGVRLTIKTPDYARIVVNATIRIKSGFDVNPQGTASRAENMIVRYINTLLPDDKLVYTQLTQAVLDASEAIGDVSFQTLQVDGIEIPRANYAPKDGYQIIPTSIEVTPA